ncbi:SDR family NAD(P)-dependent oxidoreductase, partial [Mesorhizobium sp. M2D.F.Ca.ET.145.01.1.1]
MSLKDKKIVVTGGSRGLGLGLVEALVGQGAEVTVVARGAEALEAVVPFAELHRRDVDGQHQLSRP